MSVKHVVGQLNSPLPVSFILHRNGLMHKTQVDGSTRTEGQDRKGNGAVVVVVLKILTRDHSFMHTPDKAKPSGPPPIIQSVSHSSSGLALPHRPRPLLKPWFDIVQIKIRLVASPPLYEGKPVQEGRGGVFITYPVTKLLYKPQIRQHF